MPKPALAWRVVAVMSLAVVQAFVLPNAAQAAISVQSAWVSQYAAAGYPSGAVNTNYSIAAGTNRVLLVAIASTATATGAQTVSGVTYGGQALTLAAGDGGSTATWNHSYLYYLNDAGISAASGTSLNVTVSGGTAYYTWVYAAVYAGVDQATPFTDARNYNSATADTAVGPFNPTLTINANDQAIEIVNLARSASGTTARTISTWATGWTTAGVAPASITTNGPCATMYIRDRNLLTAANDGSQHTAGSANTWDSMTAGSLKVSVAVNTTAAGTVTATSTGCTQITINAPYTNDSNANNTLSYRYRTPSGTGAWVGPTTRPHSASPYNFNITPLAFGATYDVEVTYVDADGVTGTAVQTVSNILVGANCTGAGTMAAVQTSGATPSILVTAPYTNDANANNTLSYRFRTPSGGTYGAPTALGHSATPYSFTIPGLTCGSSYDVEVTYLDGDGIGAGTAVQTVSAITLTNCATAGAPTGIANSCSQVTVSAPYTNNANANGSTAFARGTAPAGPFTAVTGCTAVTGASPRQCVDTTVAASTTYYYQVTVTDPEGVTGTNPAVTAAITTPACSQPILTTGTPTATVNSCTQITVSCPFTGDTNNNSTTKVEYNTSNTWPGTTACASLIGTSPRTCAVTPLAQASQYWFRVTFTDADGVTGANPQVIGSFTTQDCRVAPGAPSAAVNSCNQITVSAPFSGDLNANSTTTFSRGASGTGPWTAVCSNIVGATPRACVDNGVAATSSYYYQVSFADADGISGTNPQVIGPFTTPSCTVNPTTVGTATAIASGCRQLTVTAPFTGDGNNNGSVLVEYNTTNAWTGTQTTACAAVTGVSPRMCLVTGLTASTAYYVRVTFTDADGVTGTNPQVIGPVSTPACAGNGAPPMVMFVAPAKNATVGGSTVFKVQVYAPNGITAANILSSVDGGATAATTQNTNYSCGTSCGIYEFTVATTALSNGSHYATAQATDTNSNVAKISWPFVVNNSGTVAAGAGNLLRRTHGSQLCIDCHNLETHSSQQTSFNYGSWAEDCLTCHQPHATKNIYLVKPNIETPNSGVKSVSFYNTTGVAANSFGTPTASGNGVNVCEVCHTKTKNGDGTARARNNASTDWTKHYTSSCIGCHPHGKGFAAGESEGGSTCSGCHKTIWDGMTGGVAKTTKHTLGAVLGTNDAFTDSGITWGGTAYTTGTATFTNATTTVSGSGTTWTTSMVGGVIKNNATGFWYDITAVGSATSLTLGTAYGQATATGVVYTIQPALVQQASTARSCVNMCHQDHIHNAPATSKTGAQHMYNAHADASSSAGRAVTRNADGSIATGTPGNTDFTNSGNGGMCLSCHRFPVNASHPELVQANFNASAHNYSAFGTYGTWQYTQHDTTNFLRNCTKCHADRADARPGDTTTPFGAVHFGDYSSLLAGATNPATVNGTVNTTQRALFVCYNCHGNGAVGVNLSGKDIASQIAHASTAGQSGHPADADGVHTDVSITVNEYQNAAFGNTLGVTGRHSSCLDCHDAHEAKAGTHATPGNLAGSALQGAWGAQLSTNPAFWTAPTAASFTKKTIVAGTDVEATLCFKCHSSYYGTLPNSPSSSPAFAETDTAREFNPTNVGNYATTGTTSWQAGETAGSFHPVLASAAGNLGAITLTNLVTTSFPWSTSTRNLMTCTDCHESDVNTDPNGPHGSAAKFVLRGPNTTWDSTVTIGNSPNYMPTTTFCANCHSTAFTGSRGAMHTNGQHTGVPCMNCHSAIPHGGPRPGFLNPAAGTNTTNLPAIATWDGAAPYWQGTTTNRLYLVSYPATSTTAWAQGNCGCNGSGH